VEGSTAWSAVKLVPAMGHLPATATFGMPRMVHTPKCRPRLWAWSAMACTGRQVHRDVWRDMGVRVRRCEGGRVGEWG
jgi:hypothetical protein